MNDSFYEFSKQNRNRIVNKSMYDSTMTDVPNPDLVKISFEEMLRRKEGKSLPDTKAADKYFIDGFVTSAMSYEFNVIAYEFLKHKFDRLKEFDSVCFYDNSDSSQSTPDIAFQNKILNMIYNAAKTGDEYSVELIKYLYKTFHKKEYNNLKRFSKMSMSELYDLSVDEDGLFSIETQGRILGMCNILGIKLDESCMVAYPVLQNFRKKYEEEERREPISIDQNLFEESLCQVDIWREEKSGTSRKSQIEVFDDNEKLIDTLLQFHCYPENFLYHCDGEYYNLTELFAKTLTFLKMIFPKREFTFEDVQAKAPIVLAVETIACICDNNDQTIDELLGLYNELKAEGFECRFDPSKITYSEQADSKTSHTTAKPVNIIPVKKENVDADEYLEEIASLRARLEEKEREVKNLKAQYEHIRNSYSEVKGSVIKYEKDRDELIALRTAMYEMSEEIVEPEPIKIDEMQKAIADKKIVIIGGNVNWVKKISQVFPSWKFISANVSSAISSSMVVNSDKVYFFTDTLGHSNYYKYMQVVRECEVPFGYLHGVNIEGNIGYIYSDLINEK